MTPGPASGAWWRYLPGAVAAAVVVVAVAVVDVRLVGPALLVVAAAFALWWWRRDRARGERLDAYATTHGWTFAGRDDGVLRRWSGAPFADGRDRRADNVLSGHVGRYRVVACDYRRSVYALGEPSTESYAVLAADLGRAGLPPLEVTSLPRPLLGPDPRPGAEPFDRAFTVTCADPAFAGAVLTPAVRRLLVDEARGAAWRVDGTDVVLWRRGRLRPQRLQTEAVLLTRLADAVSAAAASR